MAERGTDVTVVHRVSNESLFPLEYSAWALTMMAPGGVAISGFPPRGKHPANLEATNPLVMWAYTNLADKRWTFTKKYLALRQDPNNSDAQKLGMFNPHTWGAYVLNGEVFIKQAAGDAHASYPDFGCSFETFTNNEFLEMETLSPLKKVAPGETVEQTEHWSLHKNVRLKDSINWTIIRKRKAARRARAGREFFLGEKFGRPVKVELDGCSLRGVNDHDLRRPSAEIGSSA